jgi:hypothetical protein
MCIGKDSGKLVMQKTVCCDSLYRLNICTLKIHCQLMLVFGDGVLRLHHLGEGAESSTVGWHPSWRLHLSYWQIKNMWTQSTWWDWFWKTIETQFKIYPLHWSDLWKLYPTLSMYNWDTAVCVCTWLVPRNMMEVHKNWYLLVLFHFFSHLKGEQMGSLDPW